MPAQGMVSLTELSETEAEGVRGGTPLQYAIFFIGCFKAGFFYGYTEIGPALLG